MHEKIIRRDGQALIDLIDFYMTMPEEELPAALGRPLNSTQTQQVKLMRLWVEELAEQLNVAPEILARKKDYEFIARYRSPEVEVAADASIEGELPSILLGWRREVLGNRLLVLSQ